MKTEIRPRKYSILEDNNCAFCGKLMKKGGNENWYEIWDDERGWVPFCSIFYNKLKEKNFDISDLSEKEMEKLFDKNPPKPKKPLFCQNCGNKLEDGNFCPKCGEKIKISAELSAEDEGVNETWKPFLLGLLFMLNGIITIGGLIIIPFIQRRMEGADYFMLFIGFLPAIFFFNLGWGLIKREGWTYWWAVIILVLTVIVGLLMELPPVSIAAGLELLLVLFSYHELVY